MLLPSNLLKTAAALCSRLSLASRSPSQHVKVGIYHGLQLPKRRDGETNLAFTKRKEMIKEAQIAERERTQREFKERKITIVVATEAFGMGINNPCVHRGRPLISCCLLTSFSPVSARAQGYPSRDPDRSTKDARGANQHVGSSWTRWHAL